MTLLLAAPPPPHQKTHLVVFAHTQHSGAVHLWDVLPPALPGCCVIAAAAATGAERLMRQLLLEELGRPQP